MNSFKKLIVEWEKKCLTVDISGCLSVRDLKNLLWGFTGLKPNEQSFTNLKFQGRPVEDSCDLELLNLTPKFVLLVTKSEDTTIPVPLVIANVMHLIPSSVDKLEEIPNSSKEEKINRFTKITVEWNNIRFKLDITGCRTIGCLKGQIYRYTGLLPNQQKWTNFPFFEDPVHHSCGLDLLNLTPDTVLLVISNDGTSVPKNVLHPSPSFASKLEKLRNAREERGFKILQDPRPGKPLLVLDIDLTIFDYTPPSSLLKHFGPRPHLHEFLTRAYEDYDLALWSSTTMDMILTKVVLMEITNNKDFSIIFYINKEPLISVVMENFKPIPAKSLEVIWQRFPQYNQTNTLICDDMPHNLFLNPRNGLLVVPYTYRKRRSDTELLEIVGYLKYLVTNFADFSLSDHMGWRENQVPVP